MTEETRAIYNELSTEESKRNALADRISMISRDEIKRYTEMFREMDSMIDKIRERFLTALHAEETE